MQIRKELLFEIPFLEYSDLSAVEGIVGVGEGEWEGEKMRGVQVGVKVTNGASVG